MVRFIDVHNQPDSDSTRDNPTVSVIVACFNIENYVGSCLASIAAQTYSKLEVILVDDGSTDRTSAILEESARTNRGWQVVTKANGGLSSARNAGIEASTGEWLVFVDGDDILAPQAIGSLLEVAAAVDVQLVCGGHAIRSRGRDIPVNVSNEGVRELTQREAFDSALYHGVIDVSAWGKIYHRRVFESIRYPEGRIYEDTYVFGDVLGQVDKIAYIDEPLYYYVMREGSIVNTGWAGKQAQFIDSVDKFVARAEGAYPDLALAANRRRVHARLSVLRYMQHVSGADRLIRDDMVSYIRRYGKMTLKDPRSPRRDKVGIALVRLSPKLFFMFWKAYSLLRSDR